MDLAGGMGAPGTTSPVPSEMPASEARPGGRPVMARAGWAFAIVAAVAIAVPVVLISMERTSVLRDLERRLGILAQGRAEVIEIWLEGLTHPIDKVVDSELFRLFATEVDLSLADMAGIASGGTAKNQDAEGDALAVPLAAQIPFMSQVLTDFAKTEGYTAAALLNREGIAYAISAGAPEISAAQRATAAQTLKSGVLRYGPLRDTPGGLVMDIFAPVLSAQSETGRGPPVGVALMSAPVNERLKLLLAPPPLTQAGERLRLVQIAAGTAFEVSPGESPSLRALESAADGGPAPATDFAKRGGIAGGSVYSLAVGVSGPAWHVVQEIDAKAVSEGLGGFIAAVVSVAVLLVLAIAAVFGAFWWRLANEHSRALADQFRRLAARIEAQKRLLDSINNTITDHIGLKSLDGTYRYVNPAFARTIGKDVNQAVGLDDAAIFGAGTAQRLKVSDKRVLASGEPVTVSEEVYLGAKAHHLQITKVPYRDEAGVFSGIVSVTRDVTELVEEQKKHERAIRQTVAALVRAVELRDPHLAGHSRRVAGFAAAVAQRLGASAEVIATVEIAADLSQIGKLGVPREILNKPGRLTPAQIKKMQAHLTHTEEILRDIDFNLPVLDTIMAMHERLDGQGYPAGLKGAKISLAARILGACDVFCARLEPRAYRRGIAPEAAMEILEDNAKRYDPTIIAALREVAQSVAGEKLLADLETA